MCPPGFQHFGLKDSQTALLGSDGRFAFIGLIGPLWVSLTVKGYGLAAMPAVLHAPDTSGWTWIAISAT